MSFRRLHVLVSRLPRESATASVRLGGRELADWTQSVELLALIDERLQDLRFLYQSAHLPKKDQHKAKRTQPHPRPAPDTSE